MTSDENPADVIEQAARAIHDTACDCGDPHPCDYAAAHAVADAHLLADPADRDELIHAREVAELAEKDRRTYHRDAIRAQAEVAELRATVDRVRALVDDRDALPRLPIGRGKSVFVSTAEVRAALDGGAS